MAAPFQFNNFGPPALGGGGAGGMPAPTGGVNTNNWWNFGGQAPPSNPISFGMPTAPPAGGMVSGNPAGPPQTTPPPAAPVAPANPAPAQPAAPSNPMLAAAGAGGGRQLGNPMNHPFGAGGAGGNQTTPLPGTTPGPNNTAPGSGTTTPTAPTDGGPDATTSGIPQPAAGATSQSAIPDYGKFREWWIQNGGASSNYPSIEDWIAGNFTTPAGQVVNGWSSSGNLPQNLEDVRTQLEGAGINVPFAYDQGSATYGTDRGPASLQNWLAGPLFTNQVGTPTQADMALNLQYGQALDQGARSAESEQILKNLMHGGRTSQANQLSEQMMRDYQQFASSGALDDMKAQQENQARAGVAASTNSSMNQMRDFGLAGQGQAASGAVNQAHNLGNRNLQEQMLQIAQQDEQRRQGRFGLGSQMAQGGANVYGQMVQNPQMQYAGRMEQAQNPGLSSLIESLYQTGNLAQGQAFARGQDQNQGAGIMSGAMAGAGAGSVMGPWGALGGAVLGGISGAQ